jgi:drug/metabolite transporter (DMT)-like permease
MYQQNRVYWCHAPAKLYLMVQTLGLSAVSALSWGAADFLGGAWRRGTPVFVVVAVSQLIGLVVLAPILIVHGVAPPADPRLLLAGLSGLGVTLELGLIYFAISRGDAFITAPVGALGSALAVAVGLVGGDRLDPAIALGLICALVGGGVSAWRPNGARSHGSARSTVGICLGAALGVGVMLSSFHAAGRVDPYWATTAVTAATAVPAGLIALAGSGRSLRRRLPPASNLGGLTLVALAGVVGDLAYAAASRHGELSLVSAISSLYPISTMALGVLAQHQRTRPVQAGGIVLALAGAALLGAAAG